MTMTITRDLRLLLGATRDQGIRPTCCAFACSDAHAALRPPWDALSCEYAFYHGARQQGTGPGGGVHLRHMLDAIEHDGQPREAGWPYLAAVPSPPNIWAPPSDVGELFNARGARTAGDVAAIRAAIDAGEPAIVILQLSDAFYFGPDDDGVIDSPESPDPARVHAVVAVGHGTRGGNGLTLVRNSWGAGWGLGGHAWLSDRYLKSRIVEFGTVKRVS